MEILKKMIADQEKEYKEAKRKRAALKQLLKLIKEDPEINQKINAWALADYMRFNTPNINGKNEFEKIHREALEDVNKIFNVESDVSQIIWSYKHYLKKQIEKDLAKKAAK